MKFKPTLIVLSTMVTLAGCGGGGGSGDATPVQPPTESTVTPIAVKATSYENEKTMGLTPATMPNGVDQNLRSYARADFLQRGTFDMMTVETKYNSNVTTGDTFAQAQTKPAQLSFFKLNADGSYTKDNNVLVSTDVCVGPSKVYVADFNGDKIPDLFIACHGYDGGVDHIFPGDKNWVVLSNKATGKFVPKIVESPIAFYHAAAAADMDGDGKVDVVAVDPANGLTLFKNDGVGNFTVSHVATASAMTNYYQVDIIDISDDKKLDIMAGGFEDVTSPAPTIVMYGNGTADFSTSLTTTLPAATGFGSVSDFLYVSGYMYIARTANGGVSDRAVQVINLSNMHNCIPFSDHTGYQVNKLLPTTTGVVTENPYYQITEVPYAPDCAK